MGLIRIALKSDWNNTICAYWGNAHVVVEFTMEVSTELLRHGYLVVAGLG